MAPILGTLASPHLISLKLHLGKNLLKLVHSRPEQGHTGSYEQQKSDGVLKCQAGFSRYSISIWCWYQVVLTRMKWWMTTEYSPAPALPAMAESSLLPSSLLSLLPFLGDGHYKPTFIYFILALFVCLYICRSYGPLISWKCSCRQCELPNMGAGNNLGALKELQELLYYQTVSSAPGIDFYLTTCLCFCVAPFCSRNGIILKNAIMVYTLCIFLLQAALEFQPGWRCGVHTFPITDKVAERSKLRREICFHLGLQGTQFIMARKTWWLAKPSLQGQVPEAEALCILRS